MMAKISEVLQLLEVIVGVATLVWEIVRFSAEHKNKK